MRTVGVISVSDCKRIFGEEVFSRLMQKAAKIPPCKGSVEFESLPKKVREVLTNRLRKKSDNTD